MKLPTVEQIAKELESGTLARPEDRAMLLLLTMLIKIHRAIGVKDA
jgi:hypothetical protein